ncbi:MAG: TetR family transcriptional regulator [Actinobacteria bacterium]|nr:TetR family transcriptional regulator [Actinomycetota bacterium]MBI3686442.1 TetR family transcriptional regulator [Actinomycetota bacterium]
MPKLVDHAVRRREVAEAVVRLILRDGVEAVTIRHVATESGWSPGVLAHYFTGKDALLLVAFGQVSDALVERTARRHVVGPPLSVLRWTLRNALPMDPVRRDEVRVWFAFLGHALARPALAEAQRRVYTEWEEALTALLRQAAGQGELAAGIDPATEAVALVSFVDGLALQAVFGPDRFPAARLAELLDRRLAVLRAGSGSPSDPADGEGPAG